MILIKYLVWHLFSWLNPNEYRDECLFCLHFTGQQSPGLFQPQVVGECAEGGEPIFGQGPCILEFKPRVPVTRSG